jgi:hypothetical protein
VEAILNRCKKNQLRLLYKIPDYQNCSEFLAGVAQKQGKLLKVS